MGATAMRGRVVVGVSKDASDRVYIVCDARDTFKALQIERDHTVIGEISFFPTNLI